MLRCLQRERESINDTATATWALIFLPLTRGLLMSAGPVRTEGLAEAAGQQNQMEEIVMNTEYADSPFFPALEEQEEEYPFTANIEADLYGVKSDAFCPQCGE